MTLKPFIFSNVLIATTLFIAVATTQIFVKNVGKKSNGKNKGINMDKITEWEMIKEGKTMEGKVEIKLDHFINLYDQKKGLEKEVEKQTKTIEVLSMENESKQIEIDDLIELVFEISKPSKETAKIWLNDYETLEEANQHHDVLEHIFKDKKAFEELCFYLGKFELMERAWNYGKEQHVE